MSSSRSSHSTVNYKDGLALTGRSPVVRKFPMIPGIDLAGMVETSAHPKFKPGDKVLLNGFGLSETHYGGYAELARVKGDWLVPLPPAFTPAEAMAIGTAGYTAMLCVLALEDAACHAGQRARSSSPARRAASDRSRSRCWRSLAITVIASTGRPEEDALSEMAGRRRNHSACGAFRRTAHARQGALGGRASTASAPRRSPTSSRPRPMAARSRPAGWPAAWICRPAWRRSSCAASRFWESNSVQMPMPRRLQAWNRLATRSRREEARRDDAHDPAAPACARRPKTFSPERSAAGWSSKSHDGGAHAAWIIFFSLRPGIVIGLIVAAPIGPVNLICIRRTLAHRPAQRIHVGARCGARRRRLRHRHRLRPDRRRAADRGLFASLAARGRRAAGLFRLHTFT